MGKVTLPHIIGGFMANVYIEEFPIDKGIIDDKHYSSILYIDFLNSFACLINSSRGEMCWYIAFV